MAEGILLSQATFDRIMEAVRLVEEGRLTILPGEGLRIEEQGPGGTKIGIDMGTSELETCEGTVTVYTPASSG